MSISQYIPLIIIVLIFYGTPGPATLSVAASGAAYGFKKSLPYIFGIIAGLIVNTVVASLGVVIVIERFPLVYEIFKYLSLGYILYLAYKIAGTKNLSLEKTEPLKFIHGFILNSINPKAYIGAIAILTQFSESGNDFYYTEVLIIITILIIALLVDFAWCFAGNLLSKPFASIKATSIINKIMAGLIVISVLYMMFIH